MARTAHRSIGNEPCGLLPSLNHGGGREQGQNNGSRYRTLRRTHGLDGETSECTGFIYIVVHHQHRIRRQPLETPFELNDTEPAVFHGDRGDATVPFMHQRCEDVSYLCDETFGWERVDIPFDDDSELRIVLPDPETLETLVKDPIALRRAFSTELTETLPQEDKQELTGMDRLKAKLAARKNPTSMPIYANTVTATVALPRFEIDSAINGRTLVSILQSLGITDAFDPTHADFSGICEGALAISSIMQGTHIEVNEHGARAAAYTGIAVAGAAPQWGREITFTVDRPFMYALMTRDRLPLFVGAVRNL